MAQLSLALALAFLSPLSAPSATTAPSAHSLAFHSVGPGGGGRMAAFGILAALRERDRSGVGQVVDVSMADGALSWLAMTAAIRKVLFEKPKEFDPRKYLAPARAKVKELVRHKVKNVLCCAGHAFD